MTPFDTEGVIDEIFCPNCNITIKSQRVLKIDRFPKIFNIQFDYDIEHPPNCLPFVLEQEIDLSYFAFNYSKQDHVNPYSNSTLETSAKKIAMKESKVSDQKNGLKSRGFNIFKRNEKHDAPTNDNEFSKIEISSVVINPGKKESYKYQLNAFSLLKQNIQKNTYEIISYIKIKQNWFEFSGKGVNEAKDFEKILQSSTNVPLFTSYILQIETQQNLDKEELKQYIACGQKTEAMMQKTFYMPDNFTNRFMFIDNNCKQLIEEKFCKHNKLKPDYHDVVISKQKLRSGKKTDNSNILQKKPEEIVKNLELIDGSFASLKYFATSYEIPLNLAKKFVYNRGPSIAFKDFDIETVNYFQACKDCLSQSKNFALRRILEKAMIFNFMKSPENKTQKRFLVDANWFKGYRNFLIPDLTLFNFKKHVILEREPPKYPFNCSMKQRLIDYREKNKSDKKIAEEQFVQVDKRLYSFFKAIYKSENCLLIDNKSIYIDNSETLDMDLLYTVEEKFVFDKIEQSLESGFNFDKMTQMQLYELNKKLNVLIEFAMDSCFKQLFSDVEISREIINKYLPKALGKFVRFFNKHQTDFLHFDPCKVIFSIFNKNNSQENSIVEVRQSIFFPNSSQVFSIEKQRPADLNNSSFYKSGLRSQKQPENVLTFSILQSPGPRYSENKDVPINNTLPSLKDSLDRKIEKSQRTDKMDLDNENHSHPKISESDRTSFNYYGIHAKEEVFNVNNIMLNESNIIKLMDQSTLNRVYNNGGTSKQQSAPKAQLTAQTLINRISIDSQFGRESISSINSRNSRRSIKTLHKKNIGNLLKNAQNIIVMNENHNRDTIQLDDSFDYRFENNSFFSRNTSNRDTLNEWAEKNQAGNGGKRTDFNLSQMNVLIELSDDNKSEAESSKKKDSAPRKNSDDLEDDNNEHDGEFSSQDLASKMPKKSRFCNPQNIKIFRQSQSENESFNSQSSDGELTEKLEKHIEEQNRAEKPEINIELLNVIKLNNNEIIKNSSSSLMYNITTEPKQLSKFSDQVQVLPKKEDASPKQEFFLMIVKEKKPVEETQLINLSFVNRSSKSDLEIDSKPVSNPVSESLLSKSIIVGPIKEEAEEYESSDEIDKTPKNKEQLEYGFNDLSALAMEKNVLAQFHGIEAETKSSTNIDKTQKSAKNIDKAQKSSKKTPLGKENAF